MESGEADAEAGGAQLLEHDARVPRVLWVSEQALLQFLHSEQFLPEILGFPASGLGEACLEALRAAAYAEFLERYARPPEFEARGQGIQQGAQQGPQQAEQRAPSSGEQGPCSGADNSKRGDGDDADKSLLNARLREKIDEVKAEVNARMLEIMDLLASIANNTK